MRSRTAALGSIPPGTRASTLRAHTVRSGFLQVARAPEVIRQTELRVVVILVDRHMRAVAALYQRPFSCLVHFTDVRRRLKWQMGFNFAYT